MFYGRVLMSVLWCGCGIPVDTHRELVDSGRMQQLLAAQLPAAAQPAAGRPLYLCSVGAASEQLEGPLGAVLQLCAALQYGYCALLNYNTVVPEDQAQQLSQQQAKRLAATGLLPALGAACSCLHQMALAKSTQKKKHMCCFGWCCILGMRGHNAFSRGGLQCWLRPAPL